MHRFRISQTALFLIAIVFLASACDKDNNKSVVGPEDEDSGNRLTSYEIEHINNTSDFETFDYDPDDHIPETQHFDEIPLLAASTVPDPNSASYIMVGRIDYILHNMKETQYVHYCGHVMNEDKGIYKYDCSGFVGDFVLKQVLPAHYDDLMEASKRLHPGDNRPRAWAFYDYFRELLGDDDSVETTYWKVFKSIDEVRKGDIVVVRYDDEWRQERIDADKSASTGHVMVAWSDAIQAGDNKIKIKITDCSGSGHYNDTRPVDENNYPSYYHPVNSSGIGSGWMWYGISTLGDRRPYKYQWSSSTGKEYTLRSLKPNDSKYGRLEGIIMARPIGPIQ